jgi:Mrp family chromosome partitioning ATPase
MGVLLAKLEEAQQQASPLRSYQSLLGQAVDISGLVRDGVPEPELLATPTLGHDRLVYKAGVAVFSGHKKSGKSFVVMGIAVDHLRAGGHVAYIDLENGEKIIGRRLILLDANPDQLRERFHYIPFATGIDSPEVFQRQLEEIADAHPAAVVVVDSLRGLFARVSATGASINDQTDVENALRPLMAAAKTSGLTVLVIDHPRKDGSAADEYSTGGAGAKEAAADAVYFLTKEEHYSEDTEGAISIKVTSDREGRLPVEPLFWRCGGQGSGNPFTFRPCFKSDVGPARRIRDDVEKYLQANAGVHFKKADLIDAVAGKSDLVKKAVEDLAGDDGSHVRRVEGSRKGAWTFVYDESETEVPI